MRAPAGRAGEREERSKHRGRDVHHMIGDGAEPVEVREHLLGVPHYGLEALSDVEHFSVVRVLRKLQGHFLDDLVAGIGNGVDGVAETDDDFLGGDAAANILLGIFWILVAFLNFLRRLHWRLRVWDRAARRFPR